MLEVKNISKTFPGVFAPALDAIDFSLRDGDFCVLIGANGSGKSTLLKLISGDYQPDSGKVLINGQSNGNVSQVAQDVSKGTIPEMTLLENIALSYMGMDKPKFAFYQRYRQLIIDEVKTLGIGLEKYIDQPLRNLSGGQRQIIATLMAMHGHGQILLLDEHTSALDPKMQILLMEYTVAAITQARLTTLMITHKLDDAIKYGNRLIMLHQGKIVLDISGAAKADLNTGKLLAYFHKYEDQTLITEVGNDY
jgi:putative ABC transport system ATP-binding protein